MCWRRWKTRTYIAAIAKAKADIEYAKADLAEAQRQERLQDDLYRSKVVSQDALDAAKAKVALAAATIEQDKASLAGAAGQLTTSPRFARLSPALW